MTLGQQIFNKYKEENATITINDPSYIEFRVIAGLSPSFHFISFFFLLMECRCTYWWNGKIDVFKISRYEKEYRSSWEINFHHHCCGMHCFCIHLYLSFLSLFPLFLFIFLAFSLSRSFFPFFLFSLILLWLHLDIFLFRPFVKQLRGEIEHTFAMIRVIPRKLLKDVPEIQEFLASTLDDDHND